MAVKATAQITLSLVVDVKAAYRYYLLQSSTLDAPVKPTTFPPASSWDDTEPTYTDGSTNSLYFVDCTVFRDDTFIYSEVSLSSSYEAAKAAYNKAVNAENTANNTQTDLENNMSAISKTILEEKASANAYADAIMLQALKSYVESDGEDYTALKEAVNTLIVDSEGLLAKIEKTTADIEKVDEDLQAKFNQISLIFSITINGVTIGRTESPYKIFLDDNEFSMKIGDARVLWFEISENQKSANIPELIVTEKFTLFGLEGKEDTDGNINFVPLGG